MTLPVSALQSSSTSACSLPLGPGISGKPATSAPNGNGANVAAAMGALISDTVARPTTACATPLVASGTCVASTTWPDSTAKRAALLAALASRAFCARAAFDAARSLALLVAFWQPCSAKNSEYNRDRLPLGLLGCWAEALNMSTLGIASSRPHSSLAAIGGGNGGAGAPMWTPGSGRLMPLRRAPRWAKSAASGAEPADIVLHFKRLQCV